MKKGQMIIVSVILIMLGLLAVMYHIGWFSDMIEETSSSGFTVGRERGQVDLTFGLTGVEIWHDDTWIASGMGEYIYQETGRERMYRVNVAIQSGRIRFIVRDVGDKRPDYENLYSENNVVICERIIDQSGTYDFDLSMLEEGRCYHVTILESISADLEYSAEAIQHTRVARWKYLQEKLLNLLPERNYHEE